MFTPHQNSQNIFCHRSFWVEDNHSGDMVCLNCGFSQKTIDESPEYRFFEKNEREHYQITSKNSLNEDIFFSTFNIDTVDKKNLVRQNLEKECNSFNLSGEAKNFSLQIFFYPNRIRIFKNGQIRLIISTITNQKEQPKLI